MKPGFILNYHDRSKNPLFESHDPSMMWDPVSETYYSYATDSAITSEYKQGIPVRKSKNLVDFEFVGYALSEKAVSEGRDNGDFPPTRGFWAPFVEYVEINCGEGETIREYRMYYSATRAFGSSESRIWLAVSNHPEGPFENRGVAANTWGTTNLEPNAIDAHIIDDTEGKKYLVYGSFFGGIFIKELDPVTGLPLDGDEYSLGDRIAIKPKDSYIDGPEGAAVIYNPKTEYYYLLLSYGWLGDDYDVRVGRSKNVKGPYLDESGKSLNGESLGLRLMGSYCFKAKNPYAVRPQKDFVPKIREESYVDWEFDGFRGPGHGVPFYDVKNDRYFFVHHVRDGARVICYVPKEPDKRRSFRMHYLVVRQMLFVDGWPVMAPEAFAGEEDISLNGAFSFAIEDGKPVLSEESDLKNEETFKKMLTKCWEWIILKKDDNHMVRSVTSGLNVSKVQAVAGTFFDYENSSQCYAIAGFTDEGLMIWGKTC